MGFWELCVRQTGRGAAARDAGASSAVCARVHVMCGGRNHTMMHQLFFFCLFCQDFLVAALRSMLRLRLVFSATSFIIR